MWFGTCSSLICVTGMKHWLETTRSWKGLFALNVIVHHERILGQEPWVRNWNQRYDGMLLSGLLQLACSATFIIQCRHTCPWISSLTLDIPSYFNYQSNGVILSNENESNSPNYGYFTFLLGDIQTVSVAKHISVRVIDYNQYLPLRVLHICSGQWSLKLLLI